MPWGSSGCNRLRVLTMRNGVRLVLAALGLAVVIEAFPHLGGSAVVILSPDWAPEALWIHTVLLPGVFLALVFALASTGLMGFTFIERARQQTPREPRKWLDPRLCLSLAIVSGAALLVSGLILGLTHQPNQAPWIAGRVAAALGLALGLGLYLLGTAERIEPSTRRLARTAFALGISSAGLGAGSSFALSLGAADILAIDALGLWSSLIGIASLLVWITTYGGILATSGRSGPSRSLES